MPSEHTRRWDCMTTKQLLPDIDRGPTWTPEHRHKCLIRQLLRWRAQGNRTALAAMQRSPSYQDLREDANEQWARGNKGEQGDWR